MKNLLLFGAGPLPNDTNAICSAAALRTQQFLQPLQKEHRVSSFLIGGEDEAGVWLDENTFLISRQSPALIKKAKEIAAQKKYDVAFGINTFPAYIAAKTLPETIPFWADLNGWIMAEMQAQSAELGHDHYLARGWEQEKTILERADQISTVSTAQRFAAFGELASIGRLNSGHFQKSFVHTIPNAAHLAKKLGGSKGRVLAKLSENAFVVGQIGGFNNWVDEKTLFATMEKVLAMDSDIHFVSTGGSIDGIAESTFARFEKKVASSAYKNRFHLLGWVSNDEIIQLYDRSDIGIMLDKPCVETETGARNRLNEMMAYGLPIVASAGSEITTDIARWQCGEVVKNGDIEAVALALLKLRESEALRQKYSERSLEICQTELTYANTTAPALDWTSTDDQKLLHIHRTNLDASSVKQKMAAGISFAKERGWKAFFKKIWQQIFR